ncbi:MAG: hypothetical protein R2698_02695 [Microthrixaceae bacterium]
MRAPPPGGHHRGRLARRRDRLVGRGRARDLVPAGGPPVRILGVPSAYLHHDKPEALLDELGLSVDGVLAEIRAWQRSTAGH